MDKDFLNLTQSNFDYFSESVICKNFDFAVAGNFAIPKIENLGIDLSATIAGSIFDASNFVPVPGVIDHEFLCGARTYYTRGILESMVYEKNLLVPDVISIGNDLPNWHIVDAGVSFKSLTESYNFENLYTTSAVANDAGGNLSHFLPSDNVSLHSFTPQEFKQNGNVVTLTSPFGETSTVVLQRLTDNTVKFYCGHVAAATVTNETTGESATICGNMLYSKNTSDFGLAVYGVAFSSTANIITEDSCLGYAFSKFYSFRPSKGTYWIDFAKLKDNFTCSHNH